LGPNQSEFLGVRRVGHVKDGDQVVPMHHVELVSGTKYGADRAFKLYFDG
jgi:hypothetical protein